jgi:hypothetical protein
MAKKLSNRAQRRKIERDLAKGKSKSNISNADLIYKLKYSLNEVQSQTLINSLSDDKFQDLRDCLFPSEYSQLRKKGEFYTKDDLIKEINWYTKEFEDFSIEINSFIKLENNFECEFLSGNYHESSKIIDLIESTICVSQWSIEKKLLIAEYETGFKKNKVVLTSIISKKNNLVTNLLSKYQSIRIEKNLSFFKYEEIISNLLKSYSENNMLKEYLNFKLNFFSQVKYIHKGFILNIENSSSIIDKYNSFVSILLLTISEPQVDPLLISSIKKSLNKLVDKIEDNRLINMLFCIGETPSIKISNENIDFLAILDLYTEGKYEAVIDKLNIFLPQNPNVFALYEIYCKCTIIENLPLNNVFADNSFSSSCLDNIYNILSKNNKTQPSLENLHKTSNSLGLSKLSYEIFTFIHNEHSSRFDEINIGRYANLNSKFCNPINSLLLKNFDNSLVYLSNLNSNLSSSTCFFFDEICKILKGESLFIDIANIDTYRTKLYQTKALQAIGM